MKVLSIVCLSVISVNDVVRIMIDKLIKLIFVRCNVSVVIS